jgi:hypothetical protein
MCGERWSVNGAAPVIYKKLSEEDILMSGKRVCTNCGRPKPIIGRGLCGGCYYSGKKAGAPGSPEYMKALAAAKERFTDPNYKSGRGGNRRSKKLSPEKLKKTVMPSDDDFKKYKKPEAVSKSNQSPVLDFLIDQRNMHQEQVYKLNQAIEILQ